MRKLLYIICLFTTVSCSRLDDFEVNTSHPNTTSESIIKVRNGESSRSSVNENDVRWSMSDALAVFDDLGTSNSKFSIVTGDNGKDSEFSGIFSNITSTKRNIYAVYPYGSGTIGADKKTYEFSMPLVQVQNGAKDSLNLGRYCYMIASPYNSTPDNGFLYFNHITSIIDFNIKNIPSGVTIQQIAIKATNTNDKPFIVDGKVDITKPESDVEFLKVSSGKSVNEFSLLLNNAPATDFTASIVVFPFTTLTANISIVATTINSNGTTKTYTFNKPNLDLTQFERKTRTATTLDFSGKSADVANNENYSVWDGTTKTQPANLSTTAKTMTIMRASDLAWVADQTNNFSTYNGFSGYTITLGANLDLGGIYSGTSWSGQYWTPIGTNTSSRYFKGIFEGAGYKIRNMLVSTSGYAGLFGYCDGANIKNITIQSGNVSSSSSSYPSGGICGGTHGGSIVNCINNGSIFSTSTGSTICGSGGICGYSQDGSMANCVNNGSVSAAAYSGGICGYHHNDQLTNCVNNGSVSGGSSGGICGGTHGGSITNSVNNGSVSSSYSRSGGGICGYSEFDLITNCVNNGSISSSGSSPGGICGYSKGGVINNCINKGSISASYYSGGICGRCFNSNIFCCINIGAILSGDKYSGGGIIGQSEGDTTIAACINIGNSSISGVVGSSQWNIWIRDSYYDAASSVGSSVNTPVVSGGGQFSPTNWPSASLHGWGATAPLGWSTATNGTWTSPWTSLGSWNNGNPIYPQQ